MIHRLKMIWRILRDKQVVVITEDHGRMYYNWDTRSLEDVCQAKELAEILLTKPESDVCIKREYVINPHGDTGYCTKGIKSIGIKDGKFVLFEK